MFDWAKRFNIIQGVARGLVYLHHDSCFKVSNILLDEKMSPKISDLVYIDTKQNLASFLFSLVSIYTRVRLLIIFIKRNLLSFPSQYI